MFKLFTFPLLFFFVFYSNAFATNVKYICKNDDNRVVLQFNESKKLVITNNQKPQKYKIKDGITYWDSLKESPNAVIVNSFLFQKSTGKLAIYSHSFVSSFNRKYYMLCDEAY
ncbi:MAG: hypothetical protein CMN50_02090 [SAR116 cluster bacterium]|nr:hypothetical protein [SAR116 cluster bacterium]|tara:strand:- start:228 stop:566 length:339 start_codon:yes stop_codon:yes gene_type:complete